MGSAARTYRAMMTRKLPLLSPTLSSLMPRNSVPPSGIRTDVLRPMMNGWPLSMRPINALFCDGHAAGVSPKEAYDAIRSPGSSIVAPGVK